MSMAPTLDDVLERSHVVSLPMRVPFRGITVREALLIDGPQGWGEFSPFLEYDAQESSHWLACGLEMAYQGPPTPVRDRIAVNATVPAVPADQVPSVLERFPGCQTVKVKVAENGQHLADDIARVSAVRDYVPNAIVRVDANRGWSVEQALEAARALMPLEYMEQPCATIDELIELRQLLVRNGLFVRIAADESIRRAEDPYEVAVKHAADVAVVKAPPLGGPRKVLDIAAFMRARGLDITVASALDTGVGMNAGIAAVAALPRHEDESNMDVPPAAAGLATQQFFIEDVTAERPIIDGHISAELLAPLPERLSALAAPAARKDWWFNRLRESWQYL